MARKISVSILWAIILLLIGLLSLNNYFQFSQPLVIIPDRTLMLITGLAAIFASIIIFIQVMLIRVHRAF